MPASAPSLPDLLELLVADASSRPFAFGVSFDSDTESVELTLCELPPSPDPLQPLVGMAAPDEWDAFGLVSGATVLSGTDPSENGRSAITDHSVWIGVIVDRQGRLWASMREGDSLPVRLPRGGEGHLLDMCRRVLGISSSAPCDHTLRAALCALWANDIRRLLAGRSGGGYDPRWDELAVLHPANQLLPESLLPLRDRAEQAVNGLTWAELHRRACDGSFAISGLSPDDCRWFDPGSFSRWVVRSVPPVGEIYIDVLNQISYDLGLDLLEHVADLCSE